MRAPVRFLAGAPEALLLLCVLAVHALRWNYTVDDAFISFRYARNLAEDHGLVYNEGERVEGYTNFLWVIVIAIPIVLGIDPVVASKALGLCAASGLVLLVMRVVGRRHGRALGFAAGLVLAGDPAFALWSVAALATSLFLLFSFVALRPLLHDEPRLPASVGLWAGLAALTRPEGILLLACLLALGAVLRLPGSPARAALLFAALVVPHFVFRLAYYGDPLPNTFYAKTGGGPAVWGRGARYLGDWIVRYGEIALLALALAGAGARRARIPLALAAAFGAYVIAVGGDGLTMF